MYLEFELHIVAGVVWGRRIEAAANDVIGAAAVAVHGEHLATGMHAAGHTLLAGDCGQAVVGALAVKLVYVLRGHGRGVGVVHCEGRRVVLCGGVACMDRRCVMR